MDEENKNIEGIENNENINPKKEKKKNKLRVFLICLLVIGIIGLVVFAGIIIEEINCAINPKPDFSNFPEYEYCDKPIIYLYPEEETEIEVKLKFNGELMSTYPKYKDGWKVKAYPDGTLIDSQNKEYYSLFWDGKSNFNFEIKEGFCVEGEKTAEFLDEYLEKLGLNYKERNEFIIYWLPKMENNKYNLISFDTDEYCKNAELEIVPKPDSLIRVFMTWKGVDERVEINPHVITAPIRDGYTVVEWGGTEIK